MTFGSSSVSPVQDCLVKHSFAEIDFFRVVTVNKIERTCNKQVVTIENE